MHSTISGHCLVHDQGSFVLLSVLQRTARLTITEASVLLGSGIGYAVGSVMTEYFDPGYAVVIVISLLFVQLVYIVFFLQDGKYLNLAEHAGHDGGESRICGYRRH